MLGNFPQAFSHVALVNTAHLLSIPGKRAQAREREGRAARRRGDALKAARDPNRSTAVIGIRPPAIRCCHSRGPVSCTELPFESTATVTGMSCTSNS